MYTFLDENKNKLFESQPQDKMYTVSFRRGLRFFSFLHILITVILILFYIIRNSRTKM